MEFFTALVLVKFITIFGVWIFHLTHRRVLKTLALSLAFWILIPGLDELITFPLLEALGILSLPVLIVYYGIGVALLLIGWFIL